MRQIIEKIVKENRPCFFISPHLDDAAFSAGGLIEKLSGSVPVMVVNVFTASGLPNNNSLSAKAFLSQCGVADKETLFNMRKKEDRKALYPLGVRVINLDEIDALWRPSFIRSLLPKWLISLVPELGLKYPTYRWHIISGKINIEDRTLVERLRLKLHSLVGGGGGTIFCPLGIGGHVDHLLVREACAGLTEANRLYFWLDVPYVSGGDTKKLDEILSGLVVRPHIFAQDYDKKLRLCEKYESQINQVIPDRGILRNKEAFYEFMSFKLNPARRFWHNLKLFRISPRDYIFSLFFTSPHPVIIRHYDPRIIRAVKLLKDHISRIIPGVIVDTIGSALLGVSGKLDIDLVIPVLGSQINFVRKKLIFSIGKPFKTKKNNVQWKTDYRGYKAEIGVLDIYGSRYRFQKYRYYLISSFPNFLFRFQLLKERTVAMSEWGYDMAKLIFFDKIYFLHRSNILAEPKLMPKNIGEYRLKNTILPKNHVTKYSYGEYRSKLGRRVFVKRWVGEKRDLDYYGLLNEIKILQFFRLSRLLVPDIFVRGIASEYVDSFISDFEVILILKYVSGQDISSLPAVQKVSIYERIITSIQVFNHNTKAFHGISKRPQFYWVMVVPLILIVSLFKNPFKLGAIMGGILIFLRVLPDFLIDQDKQLVHRDLSDHNIIMRGNGVSLLDFQLSTIGNRLIDYVVPLIKNHKQQEFIRLYMDSPIHDWWKRDRRKKKVFIGFVVVLGFYNLCFNREKEREMGEAALLKAVTLYRRWCS